MKKIKLVKAYFRGLRNLSGYWKSGGPVSIKRVPFPSLVSDDWIIVKTVYCGICGSDMKELTLSGALDNPLRSFISFPQIMGHEPVGFVHKVGSKVKKFQKGDRVAISPWLPCAPRGIDPECNRCKSGDYAHCKNFQRGNLPVGMHLGATKEHGGFVPFIAVHQSQCFHIPEDVSFEQAVLADPFSVAFHSCSVLDPDPNSTVLIYGLGAIGLLTIICLKKIFKVKHVLAIGRYAFQKDYALEFGADYVFMNSGEGLIEDIAKYLQLELYKPERGLRWSIDGVEGIIDTIASAETLEIGIRILKAQKKLIFLGVSTPRRFENTLHYFKELELTGSNAFGLEYFENNKAHAFHFFLSFLKDKIIDLKSLITHKFPLEQYQEAFDALANKRISHAVKIVFAFDLDGLE